MRLKVFKILFILSLNPLFSQEKLSGFIISESTNLPLENVTIFNSDTNEISYTDIEGKFSILIKSIDSEINIYKEGYSLLTKFYSPQTSELKDVTLKLIPKIEVLNEVVVRGNLKKIFQIKRMEDVEGTRIYAGKKNEVILIDVSMANLASNNARQIYNQIPGLVGSKSSKCFS